MGGFWIRDGALSATYTIQAAISFSVSVYPCTTLLPIDDRIGGNAMQRALWLFRSIFGWLDDPYLSAFTFVPPVVAHPTPASARLIAAQTSDFLLFKA